MISLVPPVHVCLLDPARIVANLGGLIALAHREFYSGDTPPLAMTFITGPSRTADIELTLALGVHGPRELHFVLLDNGRTAMRDDPAFRALPAIEALHSQEATLEDVFIDVTGRSLT